MAATETKSPLAQASSGLEKSRITGAGGQSFYLSWEIGSGFSAVVYRAIDENDPMKTNYACKVIAKTLLNLKEKENTIREISILRAAQHENTLRMIDLFETPTHLFIVMPLMHEDLFDKISKRHRFTEADACEVLLQIARGLAYLHSVHICHRDIKPENILCSSEPEHFRVLIADYGLAKFFGRDQLLTSNCGSEHYVAPEVLLHSGPYSEACDIWSFGVVAYILFTGCFPFDDSVMTLSGVYHKSNLEVVGISAAGRAFIDSLFKLVPEERPTAAQLVENWFNPRMVPQTDLTSFVSHLPDLKLGLDP